MPKTALISLAKTVTDHLSDRLVSLQDQFLHVGDEITDLFHVAAPLLSRGKRLRAAFLAAGWRGFGGTPMSPPEIKAGAGLELFQLAALVHDDLMDDSPSRRGLPSAHLQFRNIHKTRRMISDLETFGAAGALLLGDLLLVAAETELQAALSDIPGSQDKARAVFEEMMAEVTVGQYLDIFAQSAPWSEDPKHDLDRAQRVIRAKSARYSVEHPLALGASMAGATMDELQAVRTVGLPIGEAFQLRDDVLSVFGDSDVTGKPAGDDLREGKRTVLVTMAMTLASDEEVMFLKSHIGDPNLSQKDLDQIRHILESCGALNKVEALIRNHADVAFEALEKLHLAPHDEEFLKEIAAAAIVRDQ